MATAVKFYKSSTPGNAEARSKEENGVLSVDLGRHEIWLDGIRVATGEAKHYTVNMEYFSENQEEVEGDSPILFGREFSQAALSGKDKIAGAFGVSAEEINEAFLAELKSAACINIVGEGFSTRANAVGIMLDGINSANDPTIAYFTSDSDIVVPAVLSGLNNDNSQQIHVEVLLTIDDSREEYTMMLLLSEAESTFTRLQKIEQALNNLPEDMFVKDGSVVYEDEDGNEGVFIKLDLNGRKDIYIPAASLVDVYEGDETTINVANHKISLAADLVAKINNSIKEIKEGNGVSVDTTVATAPELSVKVAEDSALSFTDNKELELFWSVE